MQTIELAATGRKTSRLGYGCSSLMGALGRKQSLALLETAFEAGIRHFDVAPMYGYGEAERCLGDFLVRHHEEITVTTKFGLAPATHQSLLRIGRRLAAPALRCIPKLKRRLANTADSISKVGAAVEFSADEARLSLDRSLRSLRTNRIDVWLLHEVSEGDLQDDQLLRFLEDSVCCGKIATFGVGSERAKIALLLALHPQYCRVVQFEWSVCDAPVPATDAFRIHHRALSANFQALHEALRADAVRCDRWSRVIGEDMKDASVLASLMLKAAVERNPDNILLFSSKNARHIQNNSRIAGEETLIQPALRLHDLIQAECSSM
jgi:D-threo-aldose 1-dehydrogenase